MANFPIPSGISLGTTLLQKSGEIGGSRSVFVKLKGNKNDLVFPTHGGELQNPFKEGGKIYAGDLMEYRTDENGQNPVLFLLKTFVVAASAGSTAKTITVVRDGYHHVPSVGDVLMVAPSTLDATGLAVTVQSVTAGEGVWTLTLSAALGTLTEGTVLVEAVEAGSDKAMLVKNPNTFAPNDTELMYTPATGASDFEGARYFLTPVLHGIAYTSKMSPIPACVKAVNKSKVNGWFEL